MKIDLELILRIMQKSEMYGHIKDMLSSELSTLVQRTNFFLVTQSVLIGALAFVFQSNIFPYALPVLLSLVVVCGMAFSLFSVISGRESSQALIIWRLCMKNLEGNEGDWPWKKFYEIYEEKHPQNSIIDNSPLPYMWLVFPSIFAGIWFVVSLYVPARIIFDKSFMIIEKLNYRTSSTVVSSIAVVIVLVGMIIIIGQYVKWKNDKYILK